MDEEFIKNVKQQFHDLWVNPEIEKRRSEGRWADDEKVFRYLVLLPNEKPPVVQFNGEIGWTAKAASFTGGDFVIGNSVYLPDIRKIESVEPPEVDGKRVAFVFAFWTGYSYKVIFDFSTNSPEIANSEEDSKSWVYGNAIGEYLQGLLEEQTVKWYEEHATQLTQIGLWAVPSLLPYPISEIIKRISEGDTVGARGLLVSYCTPAFLQGVMARWWDAQPFDDSRDKWGINGVNSYFRTVNMN